MEFDLCSDCGGPAYLLAASLCAVAFVLWRAGVWILGQRTGPGWQVLQRGTTVILWALAAAIAYVAWIAIG
jgi:hypothetical protein